MYMGNRLQEISNIPSGPTNPPTGYSGELFFNSISNDLYVWCIDSWIAVKGSESISFGNVLPATANMAEMFFLTSDQKVYIWNGTRWQLVGGSDYGTELPSTGLLGGLFFNISDGKIYVWTGTAWDSLDKVGYTGSAGPVGYTGSIGETGFLGSAGNFGYTPVNRGGDTMDGPLFLSGSPVTNSGAATKLYTDQQISPKFNAPAGTTTQYVRGNGSLATLDKSTVGLSLVENTSDVNKPISTAFQNALNTKYNITGGNINGNVGIVQSGLIVNFTGNGGQHVWSRNANGSERGVIWNDDGDNAWRIRVRQGVTWVFANNSDTNLPNNLKMGGNSWFYNDGNLGGPIWENWGNWNMITAVDNRINNIASTQTTNYFSNKVAGDVGTLMLGTRNANITIDRNQVVDGSQLLQWRPDMDGGVRMGPSPSGAWKCMSAPVTQNRHGTLFMRVW